MPTRFAGPADGDIVADLICGLAKYEGLLEEISWEKSQLQEAIFGLGAVPKVLLAETPDGEVAGFALYLPSFSTFLGKPGIWLEDLFVRPEHRGAGYGRELLAALRELTDGRVEWNVLSWNAKAIDFYDSLGARPVEGWVTYRWLPFAENEPNPEDAAPQ